MGRCCLADVSSKVLKQLSILFTDQDCHQRCCKSCPLCLRTKTVIKGAAKAVHCVYGPRLSSKVLQQLSIVFTDQDCHQRCCNCCPLCLRTKTVIKGAATAVHCVYR